MSTCYYCGVADDLRPYGPKGAMVCFKCGTLPEHEDETKRQFSAQLNACGPLAVIDGTDVGPYPAEHNPTLFSHCKTCKTPDAGLCGQCY